jgi:hypothetical protein
MADGGLEEETRSLRTTIGDLQWQYEELIDKELVVTTGDVVPGGMV